MVLFVVFPQIALDMQHVLDLLKTRKDAPQLIQALNLQRGADEGDFLASADSGTNRSHIHASFRDDGGNVTNQAGTITCRDDNGRKVVLLGHTCPIGVHQALTVTLTIAIDIPTIGPMDNRAFASADKAHDGITR